jgi:hypothetical protein
MKDFILTNLLFILGLKKTEDKLRIYNGYISYSMFNWIIDNKISPLLAIKMVKRLRIYSSRNIRTKFRKMISDNLTLFEAENTYFTSFGSPDIIYKSGNRLIAEFRNTDKRFEDKIIPIWKIPTLPKDSNIIFFDDLIGTGKQSTDYIKEISGLLNASHKAYLFCICATEQGLEKINSNTSFRALSNDILTKQNDYYVDDKCNYFTVSEKNKINYKIDIIKSRNAKYNLGLLVAFEHSAPNNTIPIIWKDKFSYLENGKKRTWTALLPREY